MVDPGEVATETLKREFSEEALNLLEMSVDDRNKTQDAIAKLFSQGFEVHKTQLCIKESAELVI